MLNMRETRQKVDYLRISVTDRCNLRCVYCMPPGGVEFIPHNEILSYEDIEFFVGVATSLGFSKIRLTGGEPLVRQNLAVLVRALSHTPGVLDISLTTNGILLPRYASELKKAGLQRVNISLDTLDPDRYRSLTRGGSLRAALDGIEVALEVGLSPVKLNAVLTPGILDELPAFVALTADRPLHVRFIEWMPVGNCGPRTPENAPTREQVLERLARLGNLGPAPSPGGWGPARYFALEGYKGTIGFISAVSDHFCAECNRLRLTADGRLKSCLFSDDEVDVKPAVRARDQAEVAEKIKESLARKTFDRLSVLHASSRNMSQIGG